MIKKIKKIKNLGLVFQDYVWGFNLTSYQLPEFKRYNFFYGWTGTGKTTLSKLFGIIESGDNKSLPNVEYEIEDENGNKYKQGQPFNKKIRVFNQAYIENNLTIQEGKAKSITLVLGSINKKIVKEIEIDKKKLEEKKTNLKKAIEQIEIKNKEKNKTFSEVAKIIYAVIMGNNIKAYHKGSAESDFINLKSKKNLSKQDLNKYSTVVKQISKPEITQLAQVQIEEELRKRPLTEYINDVNIEATKMLSQTVESQIIQRIKNNQDISNWVEVGIAIHNNHNSNSCEFCNQSLPENRLLELTKHFNKEDRILKLHIDELIVKLRMISATINSIKNPDKANFYDELQKYYEDSCKNFDKEKERLLESITNVANQVENKKSKTTEKIILNKKIDPSQLLNYLNEIRDHITKHNKKTKDFQNEKNKAIEKLKNHHLSAIFDNIKVLEREIGDQENIVNKIKNGDSAVKNDMGIDGIENKISSNQSKISSTHKACDKINRKLETFLNRKELIFAPHKIKILDKEGKEREIEDGYIIKRNGEPAINLSEGEKTAIAFVHFIIYLQEDFDLKEGIVVIDDPISSLDSNSLFQAFAFLKDTIEDVKQVFILTHNFEFLRLLLNWSKNIKPSKQSNHYMIKNCHDGGKRRAFLDKMDKELSTHESEYHYLFKELNAFKSDSTIGQSYPIPNMARKVLDTFLLFRVPSGKSMYAKLETIKKTTNFDKNKLTAIYKFVNDQSHITGAGFNPALVPEAQKNVKYLLEMIEEVFPEHYQILQESITS